MPDTAPLGTRLPRAFYTTTALSLAQHLIGKLLVRVLDDGTRLSGMIVETEAYLGVKDRAAHTFGGRRTERNEAMYAIGGTAYVYFTYGMHYCMNVVADRADNPVAVLLRGLEPREGIEEMRRLRSVRPRKKALRDIDLCSGPARLCEALAIDRTLNHADLTGGPAMFIEDGPRYTPRHLVRTTRIGIAGAGDWKDKPLRWYLRGNPHVSVSVRQGA